VKNAIVTLRGHIASATSQSRIEKALRNIPGLLGIKNDLILDDKLTFEVAAALGTLEHQYGCKFFTGVSHGVVFLSGLVSDETVKLLAEKCVADHPSVRGVMNSIEVLGARSAPQDLPFLQPTIGEEIFFLDGLAVVVRQVILSPNNRRVVAMTVSGRFTILQPELTSLTAVENQLPERLIVLPLKLVRYLTRVSGFMSIASRERKYFLDFNPDAFCRPALDWTPPYPYRLADVLFPVDDQLTRNLIRNTQPRPRSATRLGEALTEQLMANDSLGG
jgi:hypothetical protein